MLNHNFHQGWFNWDQIRIRFYVQICVCELSVFDAIKFFSILILSFSNFIKKRNVSGCEQNRVIHNNQPYDFVIVKNFIAQFFT